jgi:hypothetical protein
MRKFLAAFLGSLIAFVWSAIAHMNPVTGPMGLSMLGAKEDAVVASLKSNVTEPGLYFFPGMDMSKKMSTDEEAAWTAKYKNGHGLLLFHPTGGEPMEPKQLVVEFVSTLGCACLAACILASLVGSVGGRAMKIGMIGFFGWLAISISQMNWYGFPFPFIALDLIDQAIGWFLAGLLMAKMIKPPSVAATQ